jgi:hypothetical protein
MALQLISFCPGTVPEAHPGWDVGLPGPAGEVLPVVITDEPPARKPLKRKRAHEADGTFRADDPATPAVDEAWEGNPEA